MIEIIFIKSGKTPTSYAEMDRIELRPDVPWDHAKYKPWDDFGYRTSFGAKLFFQNKEYELPQIKFLIDDQNDTHDFFKEYLQKNDSRFFEFPIHDVKYVSLPTDIEFYQVLKTLFKKTEIENILEKLHESSYIKHTNSCQDNVFLLGKEGFRDSLLRDMTSKSSLESGWLLIENRIINKDEIFKLEFKLDNFSNSHKIDINFKESIFPSNINVLIGANGTGKSQALKYFTEQLLGIKNVKQKTKLPVFNQIVLIAYSPFESYMTSLEDVEKIRVKSSYKYFGFRTEKGVFKKEQPAIDTVEGLFKLIVEDDEKDFLDDQINKYDALIKILKKAITFKNIGLVVNENIGNLTSVKNVVVDSVYIIKDEEELLADLPLLKKNVDKSRGIVFLKNNSKVYLSSGQQIFSYLITCAVSAIRKDTILLIDEPEVYLHPNLEVDLMNLLKELLEEFRSYAIIATHSLILAREVSKNCTIIFKTKDARIDCINPPFETFGGDMEKINSYVFFDNKVKKPYESWLQGLVNEEKGAEKAIKKYMDSLNEESLILMNGMSVTNAE